MSRAKHSKDLGNGVRPPVALGIKSPIWRLGALVFLPYSIGKVMMVKTPDRSLSLKQMASCTAGKTCPSSLFVYAQQRSAKPGKALNFPEPIELKTKGLKKFKPKPHKAISVRRGYGCGPCRQGIARHAPPCPAALHLDCRPFAKMRRYEIAF
jgi:hypothetical protein